MNSKPPRFIQTLIAVQGIQMPQPQPAQAVQLPRPPIVPPPPSRPTTAPGLPKRDEKGHWLKGQSGNPGGRLSIGEIRKLARQYTPIAMETLREICQDPEQHGTARVAAAKEMFDRGYGKAVQPIEIGGPGAFDQMTDDELNQFCVAEAKALINGEIDEDDS